jgi:hypothetical protein
MTSLGFDLLDRHVVAGRGDDVACTDTTGSLTFAELLGRSAALAGGLRALGVDAGDAVAVQVEAGNTQVRIVCACVRLGAEPGGRGDVRIVETDQGVTVRTAEDVVALDLVERIGTSDPAPSLPADRPGYGDRVRDAFEDIVESLLAGRPVA